MNIRGLCADKKTRKKIAVSLISAVLLSLLYIVIFSFSAQDGDQSGSLSRVITEKCVELVNNLMGKHWTERMMADFAAYFEHPLRKLAHFSEYACMGVLVYTMLCPWVKRGKKLYLFPVLWVLLSASADEFHQFFVPGRYGCFADVCLDTVGGACGVLFCILVSHIYRVTFRS